MGLAQESDAVLLHAISGNRKDRSLVGMTGYAVIQDRGFQDALSTVAGRLGANCLLQRMPEHDDEGSFSKLTWSAMAKKTEKRLQAAYEGAGAPVLLVGHSFGALCQLCAAAKFPERVSGLVLIAPAFALHPAYSWGFKFVKYTKWLFCGLSSSPWSLLRLSVRSRSLDEMFDTMDALTLEQMIHEGQAAAWGALGQLRGARIPILLIHGLLDQTTLASGSIAAASVFADNPNFCLQLLGGCGHDLCGGECRKHMVDAIVLWIQQRVGWSTIE